MHQRTRVSSALCAVCIDEVVSKMADFLPSRSVLSVFFPNCLLTSGEVEQLRKSKEIDKCINRDKTYVKRLVKILLLGAGESGKSTFLKQMRIIHGQDFDQKAKEEFRATIFSNVIKGKSTPSTQYETCWSCRDFGVCIALLLHGRVWCGKFVAMLAAAEPIGLHFSVLDNASGSATKKRPCYFCLSARWDLRGLCACIFYVHPDPFIYIYFFLLLIVESNILMVWHCPSVFLMAAVSTEACLSFLHAGNMTPKSFEKCHCLL